MRRSRLACGMCSVPCQMPVMSCADCAGEAGADCAASVGFGAGVCALAPYAANAIAAQHASAAAMKGFCADSLVLMENAPFCTTLPQTMQQAQLQFSRICQESYRETLRCCFGRCEV